MGSIPVIQMWKIFKDISSRYVRPPTDDRKFQFSRGLVQSLLHMREAIKIIYIYIYIYYFPINKLMLQDIIY